MVLLLLLLVRLVCTRRGHVCCDARDCCDGINTQRPLVRRMRRLLMLRRPLGFGRGLLGRLVVILLLQIMFGILHNEKPFWGCSRKLAKKPGATH